MIHMYFVIIDIYQTNPDRMYVIETQINTQLLSFYGCEF